MILFVRDRITTFVGCIYIYIYILIKSVFFIRPFVNHSRLFWKEGQRLYILTMQMMSRTIFAIDQISMLFDNRRDFLWIVANEKFVRWCEEKEMKIRRRRKGGEVTKFSFVIAVRERERERSKIENVDPLSVVRSRFVYLVDVVGQRSYVLHSLFE